MVYLPIIEQEKKKGIRMKGRIITLEGIDKAGKTTQSQLLLNYLQMRYPKKVSILGFPDYDSSTGRDMLKSLKHTTGKDPSAH